MSLFLSAFFSLKKDDILLIEKTGVFHVRLVNLVENAPQLSNWKITAFRQPRKFINQINCEGLTVNFKDVYFKYSKNSGKINLELNIRGFFESPEWTIATFILLDNILGEYDTEMSLDSITKKELNEDEVSELFPITDLPVIIKNYKMELNN